MGTVEEEADESMYWIELLIEADMIQQKSVAGLLDEANQLVAITVSSIKTAKRNRK